jgi:hypothetical protein
MKQIILLFLLLSFFACPTQSKIKANNSKNTKKSKPVVSQQKTIPTPSYLSYSWLTKDQNTSTIVNRTSVPKGYKRKNVGKGSFAEWLRYLPLFEKQHLVKLHDGSKKWNQFAHHAVVDMDVGKADLQQCADAVMRLQAEYHYSTKAYDKIHFNYTSGDRVSFEDWRKGRRPKVNGNKVNFVNNGKVSNGYSNFKAYLRQIFTYAGTASLSKELKSKKLKEIQAGDVFIQGGFPGHAILVLDVAINEKGEKLFMVGQSYMPAQEFHVLKNKENKKLSPWYSTTEIHEVIETPEWTFKRSDLKGWN